MPRLSGATFVFAKFQSRKGSLASAMAFLRVSELMKMDSEDASLPEVLSDVTDLTNMDSEDVSA